ncbi:MAG: helix-turn-helix transcriptional regulator [Candidatus Omnitrophica bacterium]|nr:helix-turn-helix transcriptional regulator [Candidatus Omnitrophota bacterium]
MEKKAKNPQKSNTLPINKVIRELRKSRGLTQAELAKLANIHPGTIAAMETGLIQNPTFENLLKVSHSFGLSLKNLIGRAEGETSSAVLSGNEKGEVDIAHSPLGAHLISYTPLNKDVFVGKIILDGKKKIDGKKLGRAKKIFLQAIIGKMGLTVEEKNYFLTEGEWLLFDGGLAWGLSNPLLKKSSSLIVSVPSLIGSS